MPRSGPGPAITISLRVTVPESALSRPAIRLINVVFPAPENPTMATNSPFSIARLMSFSTSLRAPLGPKPFETCLSSRKGINGSCGFEFPFRQTHQPVQDEAHHADRDDAKDDVLVDQGVVFLPEET